ncbi:hypothetical protein GGF44_002694 [Coemansia sp. RSA 1694]|nr:hypothetical protein GGF44_002694 [Coemansia sp. RSA 1694]
MPRPARKAAAKPKVAVATATTTETTKGTTAAEKENVKDELPKKSPTSNKRRLRSQSTAADSGIEDDGIEASPPSKRMATEAVGASPGKSPKIVTPRYGRRISSGGGVGRYQRRLTFDTDVGGGGRRTSGASDLVFDGLLDGFSPIKRNAPPETLDFDEEEDDLPQADDVVLAMPPQQQQPPPSVVVASKEEDEEKVASADDDESDSELFDIDALLVAGRHRNRPAHKPKSASGGVAARIMASSSLGDASVVDLLGQDGTAGDLLPRRTRTTRSHAHKPEAASTKPARGRTTASRARKPAANKEDQSSSSEEDEDEDAGDSWKPSKAATTTTPTRKPRRAAATSTTTAKRSATTAAASNRAASSSRASAKPKDSKPAATAASAWGVDSKTAKYFDDIDGFELTEEAV